ncbi:HupE/UreJ family protein [Gelidibacter salicanalis]|uniref:HupE/UreJ family protein n=1 Tax=Gelidibacter salicanalis TaxID=291193 RepID=A0A5C7ABM9_9FLAO|nr:HupE/UreJ family protein [Gelidibacter salicanalis]TXE05978.1 HupE/UreJ family protein [Gelidibacter salicanalis]
MRKLPLQITFILLFLIPIFSYAHKPDRSVVYLRIYETGGVEGHFDLGAEDLKKYLDFDLNLHPTLQEVERYKEKIREYIVRHASFSSRYGAHKIVFTDEMSILDISSGSFVISNFYLDNMEVVPDNLEVSFTVFLDENPMHTNGLGIEYNWKAGLINNEKIIALDFSTSHRTKTLDLTDTSVWKGFLAMIKQGMLHIWVGMDHVLFLLALILPSVVRRRRLTAGIASDTVEESGYTIWGWQPVQKFRPAFLYILKIVTFFTIAHTITLSLAALQIVVLPSWLVESIIAFSIGLAAYHNIRPVLVGRDWIIAFVFGLFHGFGFATVLGELGFKGENLSLSLLGFNIGVEIGQVVIIALIFPFLFLMRKLRVYPKFMVIISVILILISIYWMIERLFDVDFPLDEYVLNKLLPAAKWIGLK